MPENTTAAAIFCVCHHSRTAHTIGSSNGCSFCTCKTFRDPAVEKEPVPEPLTPQAERALQILSRHSEFRHVAPGHLDEIARHGRKRLFLDGQQLMVQGEASDSMHILVKGTVKVEREVDGKSEPIFLAQLNPGDIVGEMGMLNGDPRSATVTALEDLETLEIPAEPLKGVFQKNPDVLIAIMKVINERMKSTDDVVELSLKVALAQLGVQS